MSDTGEMRLWPATMLPLSPNGRARHAMAMLVQYLAAKVGVVTGKDLPELCREHFPGRCRSGCGRRPN